MADGAFHPPVLPTHLSIFGFGVYSPNRLKLLAKSFLQLQLMDPWFLQFSLWLCGLSAVLADYNSTYDDTDPSITYSPPEAWSRVKVSMVLNISAPTQQTTPFVFIDFTFLY